MSAAVNTGGEPKLAVHLPRHTPRAVVLVLHGGREQSFAPVRPWSLAPLRMRPFVGSLRRAGGAEGLVVASLRFAQRGWNGDANSPVPDARWALAQLRDQFGAVPFGLVGHSMGGRTALAAADEPQVRSVVALAPWIERIDRIKPLTDRDLLVLHGDRDRLTSPAASKTFVEAAAGLARLASYVEVSGDSHAMLKRAGVWHELSTGFTVATLLGLELGETERPDVANTIQAARAGERNLAI
ncbi:alpha/beta hydrolase family protein [Jatrophihabitans sp. GAS493]|uniref:alpha/beta hydrolase n=1 Tax=Jatrophihabitans sp. GAS493 TaxID=1907575 RepID=UPI000BB93CD2|nr:alpha/beta fold hydrolase [Jatrophihabitans sp. GAS493]SOD74053.1 alpha/beta hydrolase family protein [Jatrophihabitans sp. GAS493]